MVRGMSDNTYEMAAGGRGSNPAQHERPLIMTHAHEVFGRFNDPDDPNYHLRLIHQKAQQQHGGDGELYDENWQYN